jgi:hypothetical protein
MSVVMTFADGVRAALNHALAVSSEDRWTWLRNLWRPRRRDEEG